MSRRACTLCSFAVAMLLLSSVWLAPARAQDTTQPAAPTTAPGPMVANPHYESWAKYKPGTQVELDMNIGAGGQQFTSNVTMTLQEMTPEQAVIESVSKMSIPGVPPQEQKQIHTFKAKVPKSEAEQANLPPGATGEMKELGTEKIEVAGKTYEAKVSEFTGTVQGASATGKMWRSDEVPGGLVKMESTSGNGNMKMELIVKKVTEK